MTTMFNCHSPVIRFKWRNVSSSFRCGLCSGNMPRNSVIRQSSLRHWSTRPLYSDAWSYQHTQQWLKINQLPVLLCMNTLMCLSCCKTMPLTTLHYITSLFYASQQVSNLQFHSQQLQKQSAYKIVIKEVKCTH